MSTFSDLHVIPTGSVLTVPNTSSFPSPARAGDIRFSIADNAIYQYTGSAWTAATGSYVTTLTGDVTGTGPGSTATTVALVGGSTATNVHAAELLANSATSSNTASTIIKRDSSGNFAATTMTGSVTGSAASGGALTLTSTSHATKGLINIGSAGTTVFDDVNNRLGVNTAIPNFDVDVTGALNINAGNNVPFLWVNGAGGNPMSISQFAGILFEFHNGAAYFQLVDDNLVSTATKLISRHARHLTLAPDGTSASKNVRIQGSTGQTANLLDVQLDDATNKFSVDIAGNVTAVGSVTGTQLIVSSTVVTSAANGGSSTIANTTMNQILTPAAATVATYTLTLPASPADGQMLHIANGSDTNTITALTISGNGKTVVGALTSLPNDTFASYVYKTGTTTWYRIG